MRRTTRCTRRPRRTMPAGTPVEVTAAVLHVPEEWKPYLALAS